MPSSRTRPTVPIALAAAVLSGACATALPEVRGRAFLALHAGADEPADVPGGGCLVRRIAAAPGRGAAERIRAAAEDWARRYAFAVLRTAASGGQGVMEFAVPEDDGRLQLVYSASDGQAWAVLSLIPPRRSAARSVRTDSPADALADRYAADDLARALEVALTPAGSGPAPLTAG